MEDEPQTSRTLTDVLIHGMVLILLLLKPTNPTFYLFFSGSSLSEGIEACAEGAAPHTPTPTEPPVPVVEREMYHMTDIGRCPSFALSKFGHDSTFSH